MIKGMVHNHNGYLELQFQERNDYISCQVFYNTGEAAAGLEWHSANLYPSLDAEFVVNGCDYLWNEALTNGMVRLSETRQWSVWWNSFLDLGTFQGNVQFKVFFMTVEGEYEDMGSFSLHDQGIIYLNDWRDYAGEHGSSNPQPGEQKWAVHSDGSVNGSFLWMKHKEILPSIKVPIPVEGTYDIYFGMKQSGMHFLARIDDEPFTRLMTTGNPESMSFSHFKTKMNKEIFWRRQQLQNGHLELSIMQDNVKRGRDFGRIAYIKLVPCREENSNYPLPLVNTRINKAKIPQLILYYEPYSYTMHGFLNAELMNGIMLEEFLRMQPYEITCQSIRIGMKAQHWSQFLERVDQAAKDDYNHVFDDPMKLVAACDILQESIGYLKNKGSDVRFTANVGMNRPYLGNPTLSEKFTREHPEYVKNGDFDYAIPEVRVYAKAILRELIEEYEIDGLFLDYMRHFRNQSAESLVEIIRYVRETMEAKARLTGNRLELKVRIPADQFEYYRAMKICVAEGLVDGIIPSNVVTAEPIPPIEHYLQLCKNTGTKVYGCIDGWRWMLGHDDKIGHIRMGHSPESINRFLDHYLTLGVDGIFVYQGDQVTGDPNLCHLFI